MAYVSPGSAHHPYEVINDFAVDFVVQEPDLITNEVRAVTRSMQFYKGEILSMSQDHKISILGSTAEGDQIKFEDSLFASKNLVPFEVTRKSFTENILPLRTGRTFAFLETEAPAHSLYDVIPPNRNRSDVTHASVELKRTVIANISDTSVPDYRPFEEICYLEKHGGLHCGWTVSSIFRVPNPTREPQSLPNENCEDCNPGVEEYFRDKGHRRGGQNRCQNPQPLPYQEIQEALSQTANPEEILLAEKIGYCAAPTKNHQYSGNLFNNYLKAGVDRNFEESNAPRLKKENGEPLTRADFHEIDILARTTYMEMEQCGVDPEDRGYMEAVPAVANVRVKIAENLYARTGRQKYFRLDDGMNEENMMSRILLNPGQFVEWNGNSKRHSSHRRSKTVSRASKRIEKLLCPLKETNPGARRAWENAVSIAMEVVLHKDQFERETTEIHSPYFRARKRPSLKLFVEDNPPRILGKLIDDENCIRFFSERNPTELALLQRAPNRIQSGH